VPADGGYTKEFSGIVVDRIFDAGQVTFDHATNAARPDFLADFMDVAAAHRHIDVLAVFILEGVLAHCASSFVDSTKSAHRFASFASIGSLDRRLFLPR
jgi:hypothetical protein